MEQRAIVGGLLAVAAGALALAWTETNSIALEIGVAYLGFAAAAAVWDSPSRRRAIGTAVGVFAATFVVGILAGASASAFGPVISVGPRWVDYAAQIVALLPIPVGYVAGVYNRVGQERVALLGLLASQLVGWLGGALIWSVGNGHAGFLSLAAFGISGIAWVLAVSTTVVMG